MMLSSNLVANKIELEILTFVKNSESSCNNFLELGAKALNSSKLDIHNISDISIIDGEDYTIAIKCKSKVYIAISTFDNNKLCELIKLFNSFQSQKDNSYKKLKL